MELYQFLKLAKTINDNDNVNKIILSNLLKKDLTWLYANLNSLNNNKKILIIYLDLIRKYAAGFPLGYILGYVFFSSNKILVDQNILIPRNETEILVEKTLIYAKQMFNANSLKVLDLGTGSGCIAISLALKNPTWNIIASDVSIEALNVAKLNQELYQLNNINLINSDLFTNLTNCKFDIIVSNPPYIDQSSNTYNFNNLQHEPSLALFANNFGLDYYQKILDPILNFTNKDFFIALEIGFDQKEAIENIMQNKFKSYFYWFEKDYNNHFRFLFISSKAL